MKAALFELFPVLFWYFLLVFADGSLMHLTADSQEKITK